MRGESTRTAPLLFWLLVVSGLVGVTVQRVETLGIDEAASLLPLWIGTLVGLGIGQVLAWLRVRAWLPILAAIIGLWFGSIFFFFLVQLSGKAVGIALLALVPAAACGYLSLSERMGLASFWYPTVLWMLLILDRPKSGELDVTTALPFAVGLAALFVAYMRARETRRISIWQSHGTVRLAKTRSRTTLRASPLRAASQVVWTGLVGAVALVLAAWIAPHLWRKDTSKGSKAATATLSNATPNLYGDATPCCPDPDTDEERSLRVREYLPLVHAEKEERDRAMLDAVCMTCRPKKKPLLTSSQNDGPWGGEYSSDYGRRRVGDPGFSNVDPWDVPVTAADSPSTWNPSAQSYVPSPPPKAPVAPPEIKPAAKVTPKAPPKPVQAPTASAPSSTNAPKATAPKANAPTPAPTPTPSSPPSVAATASPSPSSPLATPPPAAAPSGSMAPWKWMLVVVVGGLALHLLVRAFRRAITLRHLRRPFWNETLDQRISNHWQRMLVGLSDAGIRPNRDEQPAAFARRVGIEGMDACATILDRVRHGVRVDDGDLEAMSEAASTAYRAARERAGAAGRALSWLRWPLS